MAQTFITIVKCWNDPRATKDPHFRQKLLCDYLYTNQKAARQDLARVENKKGYKIILTAKGVRVNIEKAKQFYHALQAGNLKPWDNVETGETTYRVREVTPEVVKVGCHTWRRAYLDNFYKVIANL